MLHRIKSWIGSGLLLGAIACSGGGSSGFVPDGGQTGSCGNQLREGAEACDGQDLAGASCETLGFGAGTLACNLTCSDFDKSACGAPPGCGDGVKSGVEVCDGSDVGGATCEAQGLGAGALGCLANCAGFDLTSCGASASCGDGKIQAPEACDGDDLGGKTCKSLGFDAGELSCAANCAAIDQSGCFDCNLPPIIQSGVLDFDVGVITLSGQVRVNGQAMPNDTLVDGTERGVLRFVDSETGSSTEIELGETGPATYSAKLFSGTYDVYIESKPDYSQTALPNSAETLLKENVELTTSGALDFDVGMITLSGQLRVNGQAMPNDTLVDGTARGVLRLIDTTTSDATEISLGETGPATYSAKLFASTYDVYVESKPDYSQTALPNSAETRIKENLALKSSGAYDFDVAMITLSGQLRVNGQAMPNDTLVDGTARGVLRLVDTTSSDGTEISLGETGPATYAAKLFASTYNVYVESKPDYSQTALPNSAETRIKENLALTSSGAYDFDVAMITLSGQLRVNGQAMPNDALIDGTARGVLRLIDTTTSDGTEISLGETGPATYSAKLFASTYDVFVESKPDYSQTALPNSAETRIKEQLPLLTTGAYDFDVAMITLSGQLRVNGQAMPNDTLIDGTARGVLRLIDTTTSDGTEISLGETGPAVYSAKLFASTYDVYVESKPDYSQTALPNSAETRIKEKLPLVSSGAYDFDVGMVTLSGQVRVNGQAMQNDTLLDGTDRGVLRLVDITTSDATEIELGETGPATYSAKLFASSYDAYIESKPDYSQTALPNSSEALLGKGCPQ